MKLNKNLFLKRIIALKTATKIEERKREKYCFGSEMYIYYHLLSNGRKTKSLPASMQHALKNLYKSLSSCTTLFLYSWPHQIWTKNITRKRKWRGAIFRQQGLSKTTSKINYRKKKKVKKRDQDLVTFDTRRSFISRNLSYIQQGYTLWLLNLTSLFVWGEAAAVERSASDENPPEKSPWTEKYLWWPFFW